MFHKELFSYDGPYLRYDGSIVARFKYSNGPFTKAKFKKFLLKSGLTPALYFQYGQSGRAPLTIWKEIDPDSYNATIEAWRNK